MGCLNGGGQVGMNARDIGATIGALGEATKSGESLRAGARLLTHVEAFGRIAMV